MEIISTLWSRHLNLSSWNLYLNDEFSKPYMINLNKFIHIEKQEGKNIFPSEPQIFRAFELVPYELVKVVILGQDPYHGPSQANGLAFAVENQNSPPPSLKNIFKEVAFDLSSNYCSHLNLISWANQGVLLLNSVLTVRENEAFSHRGKGWELFTDKVLSVLNQKKDPVVFILWGAAAQLKQNLITSPHHKILKAAHPSPLSAYRGFFGCKHFSQANQFLIQNNLKPIQWL